MGDVAMTVDWTHHDVPWTPYTSRYQEDYHNYKGWHSILCLIMMFVDSFYMFLSMGNSGTLAGRAAVLCWNIVGCFGPFARIRRPGWGKEA